MFRTHVNHKQVDVDATALSSSKPRHAQQPPQQRHQPPPLSQIPTCRRAVIGWISEKTACFVYREVQSLVAAKITQIADSTIADNNDVVVLDDEDESYIDWLQQLQLGDTAETTTPTTTTNTTTETHSAPVLPELRYAASSDGLVGELDVDSFFLTNCSLASFRPGLVEKVLLATSVKECQNINANKSLRTKLSGAKEFLEVQLLNKNGIPTYLLFAMRFKNFNIWSIYRKSVLEPALTEVDSLFVPAVPGKTVKLHHLVSGKNFLPFAQVVARNTKRILADNVDTLIEVIYYRCQHALRTEPRTAIGRIRHNFVDEREEPLLLQVHFGCVLKSKDSNIVLDYKRLETSLTGRFYKQRNYFLRKAGRMHGADQFGVYFNKIRYAHSYMEHDKLLTRHRALPSEVLALVMTRGTSFHRHCNGTIQTLTQLMSWFSSAQAGCNFRFEIVQELENLEQLLMPCLMVNKWKAADVPPKHEKSDGRSMLTKRERVAPDVAGACGTYDLDSRVRLRTGLIVGTREAVSRARSPRVDLCAATDCRLTLACRVHGPTARAGRGAILDQGDDKRPRDWRPTTARAAGRAQQIRERVILISKSNIYSKNYSVSAVHVQQLPLFIRVRETDREKVATHVASTVASDCCEESEAAAAAVAAEQHCSWIFPKLYQIKEVEGRMVDIIKQETESAVEKARYNSEYARRKCSEIPKYLRTYKKGVDIRIMARIRYGNLEERNRFWKKSRMSSAEKELDEKHEQLRQAAVLQLIYLVAATMSRRSTRSNPGNSVGQETIPDNIVTRTKKIWNDCFPNLDFLGSAVNMEKNMRKNYGLTNFTKRTRKRSAVAQGKAEKARHRITAAATAAAAGGKHILRERMLTVNRRVCGCTCACDAASLNYYWRKRVRGGMREEKAAAAASTRGGNEATGDIAGRNEPRLNEPIPPSIYYMLYHEAVEAAAVHPAPRGRAVLLCARACICIPLDVVSTPIYETGQMCAARLFAAKLLLQQLRRSSIAEE
ncbi:unnamed protein product [Trichogramma brassicae]|uniref:Uncharacterized protein n=1 Tax=Trichogramma brassicae TaxID=86971 RepID=A0A6H5IBT5_9HYME|nr:unnamed protein product [Trichogramma brassicae]